MESNVGKNPHKGPRERELEVAIGDMDPTEIEQAALAWKNGATHLQQTAESIELQALAMEDPKTFGEPGIQAAAAFRLVKGQVESRRQEMEKVGEALTSAATALTAAQKVQLSAVVPGADLAALAPDAPEVDQIRAHAREASHRNSLSQRETESQTALVSLDTELETVAEKLREVTGTRSDDRGEPVSVPERSSSRTLNTGPGVIGPVTTGSIDTGPVDGPRPSHPGPIDEGTDPDWTDYFPGPGNNTESNPGHVPSHPQVNVGPGVSPSGPSTNSSGNLGTSVASGVAAGMLSTGATVAATRGSVPLSGLTPGTSTAQIGRTSTTATRGALGRPTMTPGQSAASNRSTAGGRTSAGSRSSTGGRGMAAGQGAGSRGRRDEDSANRESLAFDDDAAWLDDDAAGGPVLD